MSAKTCRACGKEFTPPQKLQGHCGAEMCRLISAQLLKAEAKKRWRATPGGEAARKRDKAKRVERERAAGMPQHYEWKKLRQSVFDRDDWVCYLCGDACERDAEPGTSFSATADHVIPISAGGLTVLTNLRTAHFLCNNLKGDHSIELEAG